MLSHKDKIELDKIIIIIIIWYLIATSGELPPIICPIRVPGNEINPIAAIEAIVGLKDLISASLKKGFVASLIVAPLHIM